MIILKIIGITMALGICLIAFGLLCYLLTDIWFIPYKYCDVLEEITEWCVNTGMFIFMTCIFCLLLILLIVAICTLWKY